MQSYGANYKPTLLGLCAWTEDIHLNRTPPNLTYLRNNPTPNQPNHVHFDDWRAVISTAKHSVPATKFNSVNFLIEISLEHLLIIHNVVVRVYEICEQTVHI